MLQQRSQDNILCEVFGRHCEGSIIHSSLYMLTDCQYLLCSCQAYMFAAIFHQFGQCLLQELYNPVQNKSLVAALFVCKEVQRSCNEWGAAMPLATYHNTPKLTSNQASLQCQCSRPHTSSRNGAACKSVARWHSYVREILVMKHARSSLC